MLSLFIRRTAAKSFYPAVQSTFQKVFQESLFPSRRERGASARLQPVSPRGRCSLGRGAGGGEGAGGRGVRRARARGGRLGVGLRTPARPAPARPRLSIGQQQRRKGRGAAAGSLGRRGRGLRGGLRPPAASAAGSRPGASGRAPGAPVPRSHPSPAPGAAVCPAGGCGARRRAGAP